MQQTTITVTLTDNEAWALSEALRRAGFADYLNLSSSREAAHEALNAGEKVREALAKEGVAAL